MVARVAHCVDVVVRPHLSAEVAGAVDNATPKLADFVKAAVALLDAVREQEGQGKGRQAKREGQAGGDGGHVLWQLANLLSVSRVHSRHTVAHTFWVMS